LSKEQPVNEQSQKEIGESKSAEIAAPWVRPELCRLEAGAAEFGDISSADAQPGFS
jgi:hypothetical protein